jgi:pullulanase
MNRFIMLIGFALPVIAKSQVKKFDTYPVYPGNDLGLRYTPQQSVFRIWAPTAELAELILYKEGTGGSAMQTISMQKSKSGTWLASLKGEQKGNFYTFRVRIDRQWHHEVPDPYAISVGVNGKRAMIVDLNETNPAGWTNDKSPNLKNATDAVIYELHIRDASIAANSGIINKGKFLGLTEKGTTNKEGLSTGLDHLKELGITHVHLLPVYDFLSIDETKQGTAQYNWGYEPLNYNIPEGSYATEPYDGITRIKELKHLVKAFHENGLNVVMDVVYNHTMLTEDSYFNQLVPGYYYRQTAEGKFSNATACGNETASERPMMRKFMIESLKYWVKEYHIDGFRFDLMGVHDIETMNIIARELRKIKPDILLYGEGWTAAESPLHESKRALKKYAYKLDNIAVFSDDLRDGIKGSVFRNEEKGFVSGRPGMEESIKFGIAASTKHPQVDFSKVNYSKAPYAKDPSNTVSYAECHDNHVLWDKLALSAATASETERREMYKLALGVVLTSQGISFLHAGSEFLRSKKGNENSYNAGDSINAIDWGLKTKNKDVFDYVKALVKLRKEHPAFRMTTGKEVAKGIRFLQADPGIVAYTINGELVKDKWRKILVIHNSQPNEVQINLPPGEWQKHSLPGQEIYSHASKNSITTAPISCTILYQ